MSTKDLLKSQKTTEKPLKSLAMKVRRGENLILYEVVPPSLSNTKAEIQNSITLITSLLKKLSIDGINIPHVCEEKRNGDRLIKMTDKLEPAELSKYLFSQGYTDVIINRPIVHLPWETQLKWLKKSYNSSHRNFIFVGGESSKIKYPGASVTVAAKTLTDSLHAEFPDLILGGITIPTRKNEAENVLRKSLSGIEFFTSQILYESQSAKHLLSDYWKLCRQNKIKPKMICLSFAPVTSKKDIDLLTWLGVRIPRSVIDELTAGWLGMGWRSVNICQNILKEIFEFTKKEGIQVPIGLNVGYINRHNFEFSISFLEQLSKYYLQSRTVFDNINTDSEMPYKN